MLKIILVRPGSTDFDEQGRIKGTLDVPLNRNGAAQVERTIGELSAQPISAIYCSPGQPCEQTAAALAAPRELKVRKLEALKNLDHGLWHGKLIAEVKQRQPKVYRRWQEQPQTVCPPEGETLARVQERLEAALGKLLKKHNKAETIALVIPEPLTSVLRSLVQRTELGNLWKVECDCGGWDVIEVDRKKSAASG